METPTSEMVRISIEVSYDGGPVCREWSFCDDHTVYTRVTDMVTMQSPGWQAAHDWQDWEQVKTVIGRQVKKGWQVTWNPNYQPGLEDLTKSVMFDG